ncbi:MAG: hypothetical protein V1753_08430 [Pseudomonadota bacterium]
MKSILYAKMTTDHKPRVRYMVSSPQGSLVMDNAMMAMPMITRRIDAALTGDSDPIIETSPSLGYGQYLNMVKEFISQDTYQPILKAASKRLGKNILIQDLKEVIIYSEKHGSLYNVAKVGAHIIDSIIPFAVNVAFTPQAKRYMSREIPALLRLAGQLPCPYLPAVYETGEVEYESQKGMKSSASMFLAEWFHDFYEFHLSIDPLDNRQKVIVWDYDRGNSYLSNEQTYDLYKQIAITLTLYYDPDDFSQIFPWHHAAGDFIVMLQGDDKVSVKIVTARGHAPLIYFLPDEAEQQYTALTHFFSLLSLKIRLDRLDGVGDIAWADDFVLYAAADGFFEALKEKTRLKKINIGDITEFALLLSSFTSKDWKDILFTALDVYEKEDPDLTVILNHLDEHTLQLSQAMPRAYSRML